MTRTWNRRSLMRTSAAGMGIAASGLWLPAMAQDPTPVPTSVPVAVGESGTEISIWVQDYGPAIDAYSLAAQKYIDAGNDVKVTVTPIAFADLLAKMLPSIAAGTEADIMMGYTDWYVATDVSQLFLNLQGLLGTTEELAAAVFPSTLEVLDVPEGELYYIPHSAGANGVITSYNGKLWGEKGIDPTTIATWDDLVLAGQELTVMDGDKMSIAGLSLMTPMLTLIKNWIWQMGGDFYNLETGEWKLNTEEGQASLQMIVDAVSGPKPTMSYDLSNIENEYDVWLQGKIATNQMGAWTIGTAPAELQTDGMPLPPLAGTTADVVYPAHISVVTLSRRLADDEVKRDHCIGIAKQIMSADALIELTEVYSGLICLKDVYADPRIEETKFGPYSKRFAEATWPRSKWPKDHIANPLPASQELDRAARGELTVSEALANADAYLNTQEQEARERLGL